MADKSGISWTDASWTPIRARNKETGAIGWHCEPHSPGCVHCYAGEMNEAQRFNLGTDLPFKPGHRKDIEIFLDEKLHLQPLKWQRGRKIFVCSMTDLFGDFVPDEMIDKVFAIMAVCRQHTFQVLTKRSARMREYVTRSTSPQGRSAILAAEDAIRCQSDPSASQFDDPWWRNSWHGACDGDKPMPNVWLGVSAEDQQRADERIPDLLNTPAALRFVSYEPALEPIDLSRIQLTHRRASAVRADVFLDALNGKYPNSGMSYIGDWDISGPYPEGAASIKLDWIICGGESGDKRRPMDIKWAESVRQQCEAAGTAFFFKQDGHRYPGQQGRASDALWACKQFPRRNHE